MNNWELQEKMPQMINKPFSITEYKRITRYLEQATDAELAEFISAVQASWAQESFYAERKEAYQDWRASHEERYVKVQRMFPDKLRRGRGRPAKGE